MNINKLILTVLLGLACPFALLVVPEMEEDADDTNRERFSNMSNEELAEVLCDAREDCEDCLGRDLCESGEGHGNGLQKWLEEEAEEHNE